MDSQLGSSLNTEVHNQVLWNMVHYEKMAIFLTELQNHF